LSYSDGMIYYVACSVVRLVCFLLVSPISSTLFNEIIWGMLSTAMNSVVLIDILHCYTHRCKSWSIW